MKTKKELQRLLKKSEAQQKTAYDHIQYQTTNGRAISEQYWVYYGSILSRIDLLNDILS